MGEGPPRGHQGRVDAVTRWLYHALPEGEWERVTEVYAPESLAREGFVHASYRDAIAESARLYVRAPSVILRIDPRRLTAPVEIAETPRGASGWPVCTARAPGLPSSSSMRGNLRQAPADDHPSNEDQSLGTPAQEGLRRASLS